MKRLLHAIGLAAALAAPPAGSEGELDTLRTVRCLIRSYDVDKSCTINSDEASLAMVASPPIVYPYTTRDFKSKDELFAAFTSDGGNTMDVVKLAQKWGEVTTSLPIERATRLNAQFQKRWCTVNETSTAICGL